MAIGWFDEAIEVMFKNLLLADVILQCGFIIVTLILLVSLEQPGTAGLFFYLGLGSYQLLVHFIKLFYFKIRNKDRVGFYNDSLKVLFITALIFFIIFLLGYYEIFQLFIFYILFIVFGGLMLLFGPILALINLAISMEEYRNYKKE